MSCSLLSDKKTVLIIKASSFIKKGPGDHYDNIAKASSGVIFDVIKSDGEWFKVKTNGTSGWVAKKNVWPQNFPALTANQLP